MGKDSIFIFYFKALSLRKAKKKRNKIIVKFLNLLLSIYSCSYKYSEILYSVIDKSRRLGRLGYNHTYAVNSSIDLFLFLIVPIVFLRSSA